MATPAINVCFVVNRLVVGGAERHAVTLANALDSGRFRSSFVTLNSGGPLESLLDTSRTGHVLSLDVSRKLDLSAVAKLRAHLDRTSCKVIVSANPYPTLYAYLASRATRRSTKLITTFHSTRLTDLKERVQFPIYRFVFSQCDALVYVSENQRRHWRARILRARSDLTIHNGIDTTFFSAAAVPGSVGAVRREFGIGENDFTVGICAALRPEKSHTDLLEAIAALAKRNIHMHALLIGDGPERKTIEEASRRLGISNFVHITGYQLDVRRFISACDAMALTSKTETFSLSALESMALGRPMVMTDVGGASEQVANGVSGFLYQPGETEALADALWKVSRPGVAATMGQAAAERVRQHFQIEQMIARYSDLLSSLTEKESARP